MYNSRQEQRILLPLSLVTKVVRPDFNGLYSGVIRSIEDSKKDMRKYFGQLSDNERVANQMGVFLYVLDSDSYDIKHVSSIDIENTLTSANQEEVVLTLGNIIEKSNGTILSHKSCIHNTKKLHAILKKIESGNFDLGKINRSVSNLLPRLLTECKGSIAKDNYQEISNKVNVAQGVGVVELAPLLQEILSLMPNTEDLKRDIELSKRNSNFDLENREGISEFLNKDRGHTEDYVFLASLNPESNISLEYKRLAQENHNSIIIISMVSRLETCSICSHLLPIIHENLKSQVPNLEQMGIRSKLFYSSYEPMSEGIHLPFSEVQEIFDESSVYDTIEIPPCLLLEDRGESHGSGKIFLSNSFRSSYCRLERENKDLVPSINMAVTDSKVLVSLDLNNCKQ